jgi:hypothetical protein
MYFNHYNSLNFNVCISTTITLLTLMYVFHTTVIICAGYAALVLLYRLLFSHKIISCRLKQVEVRVIDFQISSYNALIYICVLHDVILINYGKSVS